MPKEIKDVKKFLTIARGNEGEAKEQKEATEQKNKPHTAFKKTLFIKRDKKITKFKLRTRKYLYSYLTVDKEKAEKLLQSIPANLNKVEIKAKKEVPKKKKK